MSKPLAIDIFCGLGGWTEGALAAGYDVVGFDIERKTAMMPTTIEDDLVAFAGSKGTKPVDKRGWTAGTAIAMGIEGPNARPRTRLVQYPGQLVLQDVLTIHGSQFRDAALIVASPPCQNYSYLAMPWSRSENPENSKAAKALRKKWETEGPDNRLFDACFRIQREASEAAGRYIPLIVENVRGAQPWVGRAKANFGSFYLWGDVAMVGKRIVAGVPEFGAGMRSGSGRAEKVPGFRFDGSGGSFQTASVEAMEAMGRKSNPDGTDHRQGSWFRIADSSQGDRGKKSRANGGWFGDSSETREADRRDVRKHGSRSNARKQASALIAKIPFTLACYVAESFLPRRVPALETEQM